MIGLPAFDNDGCVKFLLVILIVGIFLAGCGHQNPDDVLVIQKTKIYHLQKCTRVNMANTVSMSRAEAQALNCKPCPGCKPDEVSVY